MSLASVSIKRPVFAWMLMIALIVFGGISFLMAIVMTFFELLVIFLQAYVFTVLTASYVQGALADEH